MVTKASLIGIAQDPYSSEIVSRFVWICMKLLLTAGTIAVGAMVMLVEIFGLRRERMYGKTDG